MNHLTCLPTSRRTRFRFVVAPLANICNTNLCFCSHKTDILLSSQLSSITSCNSCVVRRGHVRKNAIPSVHLPFMHFSQNNCNSPSNTTLLLSTLLHVSACTGGHHQAFVRYIKHKCTYICLFCKLVITNLNFIFVILLKS
jgi:hypothetical protein